MNGALSDLLVLDLTRVLAGPYGTMILADFGAEVIKIEQPQRGDDTRRWGPPWTERGQSAYFLCANRGKRSMTLNLKDPRGKEILRRLVSRADILVENFKVGTMEKLGLGYPALSAINPGLIYCAITGYGQTGPHRDRPGYDAVIQAQGGLMSITGTEEGPPLKVGVAIVDVTAGLHAVISILAALHYRERSGVGQMIDIALYDTQLSWLINVASSYLVSGEEPSRYGNGHATIVPYQTFPTADGYLMLAVGNDRQFSDLCQVLGCPQLSQDIRFRHNPDRVAHREILISLLIERLITAPTHHWIEALLDVDVPCGPVNTIPDALADPQAVAREMVQSVIDSQGEQSPTLGPVAKMSRTPPRVGVGPPELGAQSGQILSELLEMGESEVEELRDAGVI